MNDFTLLRDGLRIISFLAVIVFFTPDILLAQPINDDCTGAINLTDVSNWCSNSGEFTNQSATPSGFNAASCFNNASNDVWFIFTASATDINIIVRGRTNTAPGGTLARPEAALYSGNCTNISEVLAGGCASDINGFNILEINVAGLIVGQAYFLRVQGFDGNEGTFQLCVNNFNPPVAPTSDCPTASILCDKSPFVVQIVAGAGNDITEMDDASCFSATGTPTNAESQSTWFTWIAANTGDLTFILNPLNQTDDLDFVVYELPFGLGDCTDKILLRCMASGDSLFQSPCMGATGLAAQETDFEEPFNCDLPTQNNFLAPINMVAGTAYALVINNFSSTGNGFSVEFGGDGEFLGPQIDFDVEPELNNQCDIDQITVMDNSNFQLGNIIRWSWTFGSGANPQTASGAGPHQVIYSSFGTKSIVLTIETDLGCIVTQIKDIFIEPCCDPNNTLGVDIIDVQNLQCTGDDSGSFTVQGSGGSPGYLFSIDGAEYTPATTFGGLSTGTYNIDIVDIKGCEVSTEVNIVEPPPLNVNAGPDITVDLGFDASLISIVSPMGANVSYSWDGPEGSLSCTDCPNPIATAPGQTTYVITVMDDSQCISVDSVTVFVISNYPIYIPNAFSPNVDGLNDVFTIYGGPAARIIKEMRIYNRWGGLIFEASNIPLADESVGWDGVHNGKPLNTGVYTYYVLIEFIDSEEVLFKGDITLIK